MAAVSAKRFVEVRLSAVNKVLLLIKQQKFSPCYTLKIKTSVNQTFSTYGDQTLNNYPPKAK